MLTKTDIMYLFDVQNNIDFTQIMNKVTILHCETTNNEAQQILKTNKNVINMVSYDDITTVKLDDIKEFKDADNIKYYYDYTFERDCDLVNKIKVEGSINYGLLYGKDGQEYLLDIDELVLVATQYFDIKLRIIFTEKPSSDVIKIYSRKYLMSADLKLFIRNYPVKTRNVLYMNGICRMYTTNGGFIYGDSQNDQLNKCKHLDFKEFLSTQKILHCETASNSIDGFSFFITNHDLANMITYNEVSCKPVFGMRLNSYIDYEFDRNCDLVDNVSVQYSSNKNIKLSYIIDNYEYSFENVTELFLYKKKIYKLRITFLEIPNLEDEIIICSRRYYFDQYVLRFLNKNDIRTIYFKNFVKKDSDMNKVLNDDGRQEKKRRFI